MFKKASYRYIDQNCCPVCGSGNKLGRLISQYTSWVCTHVCLWVSQNDIISCVTSYLWPLLVLLYLFFFATCLMLQKMFNVSWVWWWWWSPDNFTWVEGGGNSPATNGLLLGFKVFQILWEAANVHQVINNSQYFQSCGFQFRLRLLPSFHAEHTTPQ